MKRRISTLLVTSLFSTALSPTACFVISPPRTSAVVHGNRNIYLKRRSLEPPLRISLQPFSLISQKMKTNGFFQKLQKRLVRLFARRAPDSTLARVQTVGETSLAAMALIAVIQGALTMHQYATNPSGELIVPPGLTIGEEDASKPSVCPLPEQSIEHRSCGVTEQNEDFVCLPTGSRMDCDRKKGWYHVNRSLVFLIPFLIEQFGVAVLQYSHLLHLAIVMGLAHIYDFFRRLPEVSPAKDLMNESIFTGDRPNIVVLGDSMSVGIGCVNEFDPDKDSGILRRIEQLTSNTEKDELAFGPVFPRVLARTLSRRLGKPVSWRSAGVDGGDTSHIRELLLPVIQEEVDHNRAPELVVVLTGSNDLKRIISTESKNGRASIRGFRSDLMGLVKDIQDISPKTRVVFPALPTYRLDRNSVLNIFPLSLFLGGLIGLWDAQKIHVADQLPGVVHVDLKVKDVYKWYKEESQNGYEEPTLISADGIHPNAVCYAKWASFVGNAVADAVVEPETTKRTFKHRPALLFGWAH